MFILMKRDRGLYIYTTYNLLRTKDWNLNLRFKETAICRDNSLKYNIFGYCIDFIIYVLDRCGWEDCFSLHMKFFLYIICDHPIFIYMTF